MIRLDKHQMTYHANTPTVPQDFPKVVCLVGSSRFKDKFHEKGFELEKQGIVVLMMGCFQHADNLEATEEEWEKVHTTDFARIELCDELFVINCLRGVCTGCGKLFVYSDFGTCSCGAYVEPKPYIGESTRKEIDYAIEIGVPVHYLHPME